MRLRGSGRRDCITSGRVLSLTEALTRRRAVVLGGPIAVSVGAIWASESLLITDRLGRIRPHRRPSPSIARPPERRGSMNPCLPLSSPRVDRRWLDLHVPATELDAVGHRVSRAKTTVRQLAAEAGASPENAVASLKSAGISVTHPHDAVPRGRLAGARAALGLLRQIPDVRSVSYLALRAGMPEDEARSRLLNVGVLAKRHLKRVAPGRMRHAEDALGLRSTETVPEEQPTAPAPTAAREDQTA